MNTRILNEGYKVCKGDYVKIQEEIILVEEDQLDKYSINDVVVPVIGGDMRLDE